LFSGCVAEKQGVFGAARSSRFNVPKSVRRGRVVKTLGVVERGGAEKGGVFSKRGGARCHRNDQRANWVLTRRFGT